MNPEGRFQLFVSGTNVSTGRMKTWIQLSLEKKTQIVQVIRIKVETDTSHMTFKNIE
jgi:hypothetical protein